MLRPRQRQGAAARFLKEVPRQEALAEGELQQAKGHDDEYGAKPRQEKRREQAIAVLRHGGGGGKEGPKNQRRPGEQHGFGPRFITEPQDEDSYETQDRGCRKYETGDARGLGRLGKSVDREGEGEAPRQQDEIAGNRHGPAQFGKAYQAQDEKGRHQAFHHGAGFQQGEGGNLQEPGEDGKMPGFKRDEADA